MHVVAGTIGAAVATIVAWLVFHSAVVSLPAGRAALVLAAIGSCAVIVGFLVGAAVVRRTQRSPGRVQMFAMLACTAGGAILGGVALEALTISYLAQFGTWPPDLFGEALYILAYPAFALAGAVAGGLIGAPFGLVAGSVLRLLQPALR